MDQGWAQNLCHFEVTEHKFGSPEQKTPKKWFIFKAVFFEVIPHNTAKDTASKQWEQCEFLVRIVTRLAEYGLGSEGHGFETQLHDTSPATWRISLSLLAHL